MVWCTWPSPAVAVHLFADSTAILSLSLSVFSQFLCWSCKSYLDEDDMPLSAKEKQRQTLKWTPVLFVSQRRKATAASTQEKKCVWQ